MNLKRPVSMLALLAISALTLAPFVAASPITANLNWSSQSIPAGSTNTATYGVAIDADCPVGQTFSGTLTVVEPDGISTATVVVGATPCGTTNLTSVYPTTFTGTAGTTQLGTYTATWQGTTSIVTSGIHPQFFLQNNFTVRAFRPVPEFSTPALLIAAIGLALLTVMKKGKVLKV